MSGEAPSQGEPSRASVAAAATRLLKLSRQMVHRAEVGDWDGVMERNALREVQARRLPQSPGAPGAELARDALRRSLEMDRQVRALMEAERDRLAAASREEQRGEQARSAYVRFSSL